MNPPPWKGAVEALRNFEGHVELIQQIYLIDTEAVLKGRRRLCDRAGLRQHNRCRTFPPRI